MRKLRRRTQKKLKLVLKWASNILIGIMVVFCLYAVVSTVVLGKKYIKIFNHTFFVVSSGSMVDTININDLVIVKLTKDIKVDDIVTYEENKYFITHRVVSINGDKLITRGDANSSDDNPINIKDVLGKVVLVFSIKNILIIFGMIILIIIIIILFNFEKIFNKVFLRKRVQKVQNVMDSRLLKTFDEDSDIFYNVTNKLNEVMKSRKKSSSRESNVSSWLIKLRYVTRAMELIKANNYRILNAFVDDYRIEYGCDNIDGLSYDIILKLSSLSLNSHLIILLNAITYQDREIYDLVFLSFKTKVKKDYNVNSTDSRIINEKEVKMLEYINKK